MGNYTILGGSENPRRGGQARNLTTNVPKILDLKSSSEQIFYENCRWVPLFASIGKREFLPRDQISPLLATSSPGLFPPWGRGCVTCRLLFITSTHKLVVSRNFLHKNCFELFLSAHFLFWENLNLTLTFAVYQKFKLSNDRPDISQWLVHKLKMRKVI